MSSSVMPCTPSCVPPGVLMVDAHRSISPSKTVSAGPVIRTGSFIRRPPCHSIVRTPPRASTSTRASSRPRRMPATTAAQAPRAAGQRLAGAALVARAGGCGRGSTTCTKPALTPRGKAGVMLDQRAHARPPARCRRRRRTAPRADCPSTAAPVSTARPPPQRRGVSERRRPDGRTAHVDGDAAVAVGDELEPPVHRLARRTRRLRRQVLVAHVADEAARAVAALLDLVAVGAVEDPVGEVDARRPRAARRRGSGRRRRRSGGRRGGAAARGSGPAANAWRRGRRSRCRRPASW